MTEKDADITPCTVLAPNPNLVLREEGDEGGILFDPDSGAVRLLNLTAAAFLKLLDGRRSVAEAAQGLKAQFEDVDADADEQVLDLARDLYRCGAAGVVLEERTPCP